MELTTVDPQRAILCAAIAVLVGVACFLWRQRKYFNKKVSDYGKGNEYEPNNEETS